MKYIREQKNLAGKTVLLRADLDAPEDAGKITDDFRVRKAVPTIKLLYEAGAKVIIISKNGHKHNKSLELVAYCLADLLQKKISITDKEIPTYDVGHLVLFKGNILEEQSQQAIKKAAPQNIVLLENIRFYEQEVNADVNFAKMLASLGDIYVNDAFAMAHRNEASVSILPQFLPSFAGLNLENEIKNLKKVLSLKANPFLVIMGGAKISDKVGTIENLGKSADKILVGGGPANLFFYAKGYEIGKSICEKNEIDLAKDLLRNFKDKIVMPLDVVVAKPETFADTHVTTPDKIRPNEAIYDIGPKTILEFSKHIKGAKKMIWNGPLGFFENRTFSHGTFAIAQIFAAVSQSKAFGVVGGGDTAAAVNQAKMADQIDFVSTAGSATLDFLAGKKLPALEALEKSSSTSKT